MINSISFAVITTSVMVVISAISVLQLFVFYYYPYMHINACISVHMGICYTNMLAEREGGREKERERERESERDTECEMFEEPKDRKVSPGPVFSFQPGLYPESKTN